jgi:CheY-like chemotaxis protein
MPTSPPARPVILIAERDAVVRELQSLFLERAGYAVEFADDGEIALERAVALGPSLLITEILVPKVDGLALCRLVRAHPALTDQPVLVFSILAAAMRAHEAGATAFLRKPLIESTFIAEVARAIATRVPSLMEQK